jgi:hypothetical protein
MEEAKSACRILIGNIVGKRLVIRPSCKMRIILKWILEKQVLRNIFEPRSGEVSLDVM